MDRTPSGERNGHGTVKAVTVKCNVWVCQERRCETHIFDTLPCNAKFAVG